MTPEQKAFEAVIKERLAERARLLLATDQRTVALLRDALAQIHQQITAQPADWKLWQLTRLRDQLDTVLTAAGTQAGTAASLAGAAIPVPVQALRTGTLAVDMMYGPAAQPFADWARSHGAVPRDGLGMLVEQAVAAFSFWRGVEPPSAPVLAELRAEMGA